MKKITFLLLLFILRVSCVAQDFNITDGMGGLFKVIIVQPPQNNYSLITCSNDEGEMIYFRVPNDRFNILNSKNNVTLGTEVYYFYSFGTISLRNNTTYRIESPSFSKQYSKVGKIVRLINDPSTYFVITKRDTANGLIYFTDNNHVLYYIKLGQPVYETRYNNKSYAILQDQHNGYITHKKELHFMTNAEYNNIPKEEVNRNVSPPPKKSDSSIYNQTFNHPWEITGSGSTSPGASNNTQGFLYVNAPLDAECIINIYQGLYPNTLFFSSNAKQIISLFAGEWNIEISGMMIKSTPIVSLSTTRIKAGALNITSPAVWTLYDENKVKIIYSSSLSKKVEFPVGIYQLEANGTMHQVEIKDGETLNYIDSIQIAQAQRLNTNAPDNKIIKPEVRNIVPIENGYESVQIFARINNDEEMEVKVNGRVVGKYSQTVRVNMENFLKRNAINVISFKFNDEAKSSSYVELSGKFPGDGDFTPLYNFIPKPGKTEGHFEVPFTGKKK